MRNFRSTNLMVNVMTRRGGPRDPKKLSPHSHEDFEQASLVLEGDYMHHLRLPWTPDPTTWRAGEHVTIGAPSITVIPAKVVHTSNNVGPARSWLLDIFAPPRVDFSKKPGMVINAADYPMPEGS
jgi:mannose-6-phosphate isomerase-like protein (cupin superfamily)